MFLPPKVSQSTSSTILAVYGAIIGVLKTLKATTGIDPALLAKIQAYLDAAMAGVAGYMQAQSGYNPDNYKPVQPIA